MSRREKPQYSYEGYQPRGESGPLPKDPEELKKLINPPQGGTGAVRPSYNSYNGEKERR